VHAALVSGSRAQFGRLLLQESRREHFAPLRETKEVLRLAKEVIGRDVSVRMVPKRVLDEKLEHHRGVGLECSDLEIVRTSDMEEEYWEPRKNRSMAVLDQVNDVQNLGSLARTAFFLGVDDFVITSKGSAPVNNTVSRASAGAIELLHKQQRLHVISGPTTEFLNMLKRKGWRIIGTRAEDEAESVSARSERKFESPWALVMGSEGAGIRPRVMEVCTEFHSIPKRAIGENALIVDSLNVSVAFGILVSSQILMSSGRE